MRYEVQPIAAGNYTVVDRRYPLRPVLQTNRLAQALSCAWRLSFRSVWGW